MSETLTEIYTRLAGEGRLTTDPAQLAVLKEFERIRHGLESQVARFVLAGLSVSQLIYFSEYGMLMLRSPLPVTVLDLLLTFLLRTLVVAPVLVVGALLLA